MKYTMKDAEIIADTVLAVYPQLTPAYRFAKSVKMTIATLEFLFSPNPQIRISGFTKLIRELKYDSPRSRLTQHY